VDQSGQTEQISYLMRQSRFLQGINDLQPTPLYYTRGDEIPGLQMRREFRCYFPRTPHTHRKFPEALRVERNTHIGFPHWLRVENYRFAVVFVHLLIVTLRGFVDELAMFRTSSLPFLFTPGTARRRLPAIVFVVLAFAVFKRFAFLRTNIRLAHARLVRHALALRRTDKMGHRNIIPP
jgi:hypothetical protein